MYVNRGTNSSESIDTVRCRSLHVSEHMSHPFPLRPALEYVIVASVEDFPPPDPVTGVITLQTGFTYLVTTAVDLGTSRLFSNGPVVLMGHSSEVSSLTRSPNDGQPLLTARHTIIVRHLTFTSPLVLDLNATGVPTAALDWFGVNFLNCPNIGVIRDYPNFIGFSLALLDSVNLIFAGFIGTVALDTCIVINTNTGLGSIVFTGHITRRIRIQFSSFVIQGAGSVGIDTNGILSIPTEQYTIFRCNFSALGGGVGLSGIIHENLPADFVQNVGIPNSGVMADLHMQGNALPTLNSGEVVGTFLPVVGVTASHYMRKFTHSANPGELTFVGTVGGVFKVSSVLTAVTGANDIVAVRLALNGTTIPESEVQTLTHAGGGGTRTENVCTTEFVELTGGASDVISVHVANLSNATDIVVESLTVLIHRIQ